MERAHDIFKSIGAEVMARAIVRASKGHKSKREVRDALENLEAYAEGALADLRSGRYKENLSYKPMRITNSNGKEREILQPNFTARVYQHLMLEMLEPLYATKDPRVGRNCKKGFGITAKERGKGIVRAMKHLHYDQRQLGWGVYLDQRKSYEHCTEKAFRRGLKMLTDDREMIDFAVAVTFVGGRLPIGTPSSPFAHHLIMLRFDQWIKSCARVVLRYADDVCCAVETKQEAQALLWRIKQYWWYELGMRAKRCGRIVNLDKEALDFCGFVYRRRPNGGHNKGYTTVRKSITARAKKARSDKSWASYFGIMKNADSFRQMVKIENKMKLKELTRKIRIDRKLDAPNIEVKELAGREFDIKDYELRQDARGQANWIKCLVAIPQGDGTAEAREFHGNYQGIIGYILAIESEYKKADILPLEGCKIVNQCGLYLRVALIR